jgi:hypothetical protein
MFLFISNPLGWLAIGAAMVIMASGIGLFASGLSSIGEEKLKALEGVSKEFGRLAGMSADATIIAQVTQDLEDFEDTMDNTLIAQVASLSIFREVKAITSTRAETQVQNQIQMPDRLVVEATNTIHTSIGDKEFNTAVKKSVNEAKWGSFDAGPENIVAAGNSRA